MTRIIQVLCCLVLGAGFVQAQTLPVEEEKAYEQARQEYASKPQPPLPEEVRRLKIQAEAAIREKLFEEAVGLYTQGIRAAPWWAEGYHNRAVLLGELGRHAEAITSMQRFLGLDSGPAARAAQDKVYEWEYQAKRAGEERALWEDVRQSRSEARVGVYLEKYPNGRYASQARARIAELARANTPPPAPAPPRPRNKAMDILPGLWISTISDNQFQMAVRWNEANRRFEGTLAVQGAMSARVGFTVGELIWVGVPTGNPDVITESQMLRRGGGLFSIPSWNEGTITLNNSSQNELVTNFARFRRVQ